MLRPLLPTQVKWFSPFLLAVWDPDREEFQSLCRCLSGFSDAFYTAATERLRATAIEGPKPYYNTSERPDVWFEPTEVWELRGADLTISPVHKAAAGRLHPERGVGLRWVVRCVWSDEGRGLHVACRSIMVGLS